MFESSHVWCVFFNLMAVFFFVYALISSPPSFNNRRVFELTSWANAELSGGKYYLGVHQLEDASADELHSYYYCRFSADFCQKCYNISNGTVALVVFGVIFSVIGTIVCTLENYFPYTLMKASCVVFSAIACGLGIGAVVLFTNGCYNPAADFFDKISHHYGFEVTVCGVVCQGIAFMVKSYDLYLSTFRVKSSVAPLVPPIRIVIPAQTPGVMTGVKKFESASGRSAEWEDYERIM